MKIGRRILGSFCAVMTGWLVCVLAWAVVAFVLTLQSNGLPQAIQIAGYFVLIVGAIAGVTALLTWLVLFMWIYLLVPRWSSLWRWPQSTGWGSVAGMLIGAIYWLFANPSGGWPLLLTLAGSGSLTGGAACLFASLTAPWFHRS